jgi:hypothetical protein
LSLVYLKESIGAVRWPDIAALDRSVILLLYKREWVHSQKVILRSIGLSQKVLVAQEVRIVLLLRHNWSTYVALVTQLTFIWVHHCVDSRKRNISEISKIFTNWNI